MSRPRIVLTSVYVCIQRWCDHSVTCVAKRWHGRGENDTAGSNSDWHQTRYMFSDIEICLSRARLFQSCLLPRSANQCNRSYREVNVRRSASIRERSVPEALSPHQPPPWRDLMSVWTLACLFMFLFMSRYVAGKSICPFWTTKGSSWINRLAL